MIRPGSLSVPPAFGCDLPRSAGMGRGDRPDKGNRPKNGASGSGTTAVAGRGDAFDLLSAAAGIIRGPVAGQRIGDAVPGRGVGAQED